MTLALEVFDGRVPDQAAPDPEREAARKAAYEEGYQAGWDDAVKAEEAAGQEVRAEFARHVQDLGFTYVEARAHVIAALGPLLTALVETVLPEAARQTAGARIVEVLATLAEGSADAPVILRCAPGRREELEAIAREHPALPLTIEEEPSLSAGQVFLRLGRQERLADLDGPLDAVRTAVADALALNEGDLAHG